MSEKSLFTEETLMQEITEVVAEYTDCNPSEINRNTSFEELEFNSLSALELLMILEEKTGIVMEIHRSLKTIGDVVDAIMEIQNAN